MSIDGIQGKLFWSNKLQVLESGFGAMPQDVIKDVFWKHDKLENKLTKSIKKVDGQSRTMYPVLAEQLELKKKISNNAHP